MNMLMWNLMLCKCLFLIVFLFLLFYFLIFFFIFFILICWCILFLFLSFMIKFYNFSFKFSKIMVILERVVYLEDFNVDNNFTVYQYRLFKGKVLQILLFLLPFKCNIINNSFFVEFVLLRLIQLFLIDLDFKIKILGMSLMTIFFVFFYFILCFIL